MHDLIDPPANGLPLIPEQLLVRIEQFVCGHCDDCSV